MRKFAFATLLLGSLATFSAFADKCKDPIVDEGNYLSSSERATIEERMRPLTQAGADVRVHLLTSFHRNAEGQMMKSLGEYKAYMQAKCAGWRSADGGFKNNMVIFAVVPSKGAASVYYGDQWRAKLDPVAKKIVEETMVPRFREKNWSGGMIAGFTDVNDMLTVKRSEVGKPIVINHAADNSWMKGIWYWIIALIVAGGLAWAGLSFFRQKEKRRTAQREAQSERGRCVTALNGFETPSTVLNAQIEKSSISPEWKSRLHAGLASAQNAYDKAVEGFAALKRGSTDPDTPDLSVEEYANIGRRYAAIAEDFAGASTKLRAVEEEFANAEMGAPLPSVEVAKTLTSAPAADTRVSERSAHVVPSGRRTKKERRVDRNAARAADAAHRSGDKTVVHHHHHHDDNFIPGVAVGTVLSDHHHHHDRVIERETVIIRDGSNSSRGDPVIAEIPSGGGGEVSFGRTSDGGGAEASFGKTGGGGGGEVSFGASRDDARTESSWSGSGSGTSY